MYARAGNGDLSDLKKRMYSIDDITQDKLKRIGRRNDMSMSQVIRHLVDQSDMVLTQPRKLSRMSSPTGRVVLPSTTRGKQEMTAFNLDAKSKASLRRIARANGVSLTDVLRDMVSEYLRN